MHKNIIIDATTVIEKKDGLSQYIISLLNHIPDYAFDEFRFIVLINNNVKRKELWDILEGREFEIIKTNIPPIGPKRDWAFYKFFKNYKGTFELFHSTSNQYPPLLKMGIATVHDITFRKYLNAKWWTFNFASHYLSMVIKRSLRNASAVIAVSDFTKQDLIKNFAIANAEQDKIQVIYEGWEHLQTEEKLGEDEITKTYKNYLFYVGTTRVHKNMKNLLKAFELAIAKLPEDIQLVISGNETYLDSADKIIIDRINKPIPRIFFTGFVSNADLQHLFQKADAFIFPSLSEGFGIPILEAFYFEKPILCSNTTSLPEIAGEAALYFDPLIPSTIADAIVLFYSNPAIGKNLVQLGNERLKLFSWKKMAEETIGLYHTVLNKYGGKNI